MEGASGSTDSNNENNTGHGLKELSGTLTGSSDCKSGILHATAAFECPMSDPG